MKPGNRMRILEKLTLFVMLVINLYQVPTLYYTFHRYDRSMDTKNSGQIFYKPHIHKVSRRTFINYWRENALIIESSSDHQLIITEYRTIGWYLCLYMLHKEIYNIICITFAKNVLPKSNHKGTVRHTQNVQHATTLEMSKN